MDLKRVNTQKSYDVKCSEERVMRGTCRIGWKKEEGGLLTKKQGGGLKFRPPAKNAAWLLSSKRQSLKF